MPVLSNLFLDVCARGPRRAMLLVAVLALGACASTPPPSSPPPPPPPKQQPPEPPQAQQEKQQQAPAQQQATSQAKSQSQSGSDAATQTPAGQLGGPAQASPPQQTKGQPAGASPTGASGAAQPPAAGASSPGAQTRGERSQALEGEFDRSLGEFDERLAREQGELETLGEKQARTDEQRSAQNARSGSGVDNGQIGRAGAPLPPGGGQAPESASQRNRPGSPGDRASLPPPDDVPSGQNDDVVARQLREAAESETDPELRKKLWEEYRQYKRNNG